MNNWREHALCRPGAPGVPSEVHDWFFLDTGQSSAPAKELCSRCPVRGDCLEYAVSAPFKLTHGIWGGMTERQIRVLRARRLRDIRQAEGEQYYWEDGECPCGAPLTPYPSQKFQARHIAGHIGVPKSRPCRLALECKRLYQAKHKEDANAYLVAEEED